MKENLLGMSLQEMEKFFISMDEKTYRAKQVFQWIHQKGVSDFCEMTNLSKSLQAALEKKAEIESRVFKFGVSIEHHFIIEYFKNSSKNKKIYTEYNSTN